MGNSTHRINIRADLKTQITDIFPSPGTILIIHPKGNVQFTPEYCHWLSETLKTLLPSGVKGMVLAENVTEFSALKPDPEHTEINGDYLEGWHDAIQAIAGIAK